MSMGLGDLRGQLDSILAELEGFSLSPEMIDALTTFATLAALQTQMGQQQVAMGQNEVGMAEVGLGLDQVGLGHEQVAFQRDYQIPFQREQLGNEQILAELGLTRQREGNEAEQLLAELRYRQTQAQGDIALRGDEAQLQQIRERESYDTFQENVARDTALLNLARAREQAAHESAMLGNVRSRGSDQFTPSERD